MGRSSEAIVGGCSISQKFHSLDIQWKIAVAT